MNIDLGSFAFGSSLISGGGTPSWGTALGQSQPAYKFTYPGAEAILIGMVYCSVPMNRVSLPLGKGGSIYIASELEECQLTSLFKKVYINGIRIDYPFVMVLVKEKSDSHPGRKTIKYSNKNKYSYNSEYYSNGEFIRQARIKLGLKEGACWFVYAMDIVNQDELHMSAVIVNANSSETYPNSQIRRNKWIDLLPEEDVEYKHEKGDEQINNSQIIYYGAPGTGKSHTIKDDAHVKIADEKNLVFRTTFHPDSDYSTFVGAYKPTMKPVADKYKAVAGKDEEITYSFVPQAFLQAYVAAWNNPDDNVFLIIEEINRGNCAQIFGDLFQLLDRKDGVSEYPIMADRDLATYLNGKGESGEDVLSNKEGIKDGKLRLPKNLYIWATMNTSDQSLFPIDSAFKRRWDWRYIPINYHKEQWFIEADNAKYNWSAFLETINDIINEKTSSEDKQLGFYFCKANGDTISAETFVSKVVFYLWNDVFKDYGFDGEYFADPDGGTLEFRKFFNFDGTINEKKVTAFMKNLKIGVEGEDNTDADNQGSGTMKVSFPDNTIIEGETTVDVFMKTITKVVNEHGLDAVKNAEIRFSGLNMIQEEGWKNEKYPNSSQKQMDGYVLFLHADNPTKKSALEKLSERLSLGLIVEFVS